jgi:hypothetical protein
LEDYRGHAPAGEEAVRPKIERNRERHIKGEEMRPSLVAVLTAAFMVMTAATAAATITFTQHFTTNPQPDIIPVTCSSAGNAISLVGTGNGVLHFTQNNAGDFWVTGTFEGNGTVTTGLSPDGVKFTPTGPVYSGHMQEWFGLEENNKNVVNHATFNFNGNDVATGAPIGIHAAFQITTNANGVVTVSNFTVNCR